MPFMIEVAALLALITQDYTDFVLILLMLLVNGFIGFHEEWKAQISVDALRSGMEAKVSVKVSQWIPAPFSYWNPGFTPRVLISGLVSATASSG
jgi:H+-transporting ATPase